MNLMADSAETRFQREPSAGTADPILKVRDLSKDYTQKGRRIPAFAGINLEVAVGEVVGVLGASGCGKSSLLRTIAGLQTADSGRSELQGHPLMAPAPEIGFVFQQPVLFPWLTVRQNVAFGLTLRRAPRLDRDELAVRIDEALLDVGLSESANAWPPQLSGGMAQRVALARALARRPQLLLLDEPFGALDAITRLEMQKLLLQVAAAHRIAVLIVTHDLDEALLLGDRLLLLSRSPGRMVREWRIPLPKPRFAEAVQLGDLRLEILASLSDVISKNPLTTP